MYAVDRDPRAAKETLRSLVAFYLSAVPKTAMTDTYGIADEAVEMAQGGAERIARELPAQWLEDLVVAGEPDECAAKIQRLLDAGADSVVLFPMPVDRLEEIVRLTAHEVLPKVSASSAAPSSRGSGGV